MKKFTGLVIILAVLILGGYYGMGVLTERTIRKNIEVIDQSNGLYAEIEQYNKGLFSSDAKIKWRLHIPERVVKDANGQPQTLPAQDFNMETPLTIHHGPVIFANNRLRFGFGYAESVFPFPSQYNEQFDAQFTKDSVKPQLDLSIFVNYLNESTVDFKIPNFKLIAKDGSGNFAWLGMDSRTTMSSGMKKVEGKIKLDGIDAIKDDTKFTLSKVSSDYDLHETPAGLYLGDANFILPAFAVFVKDQKMFEIIELAIKTDSDIEQHLFNTHFNVTLKSILANGQNYGPGELEVALRNLDADVLAKINQQTTAMQNGNDMQRQQAMLALLPELPKLFNKGAEFEISKLSLKIPQGQIEGNLFVTLPKGENANPFEMMQKIQGKAKLQVPAEAVKEVMKQSVIQQIAKKPELQQTLTQQLQANQTAAQTNQPAPTVEQLAEMQTNKQINALQQSGLITVQGTDFVIEASLDQGKFTINGKPYDPSMMKF
ncbi:putative membrane protein YdgA-like protein [Legionella steigerwaltii]|uniref:Membrane protein YdgA-like protein n=1 Tax=Legionella steigerwaltii TaxID=460 RepID=A0A378LBN5_9GAMM|nr:YdgA family protein [Legionella steigerwaltii]KTD78676.1 putative membrane protein YdgA-like protein [Legionella steigerwaltii]STY24233.1 putative membrane protein YdgA-like protein [Legionella steigerwaltii]